MPDGCPRLRVGCESEKRMSDLLARITPSDGAGLRDNGHVLSHLALCVDVRHVLAPRVVKSRLDQQHNVSVRVNSCTAASKLFDMHN